MVERRVGLKVVMWEPARVVNLVALMVGTKVASKVASWAVMMADLKATGWAESKAAMLVVPSAE